MPGRHLVKTGAKEDLKDGNRKRHEALRGAHVGHPAQSERAGAGETPGGDTAAGELTTDPGVSWWRRRRGHRVRNPDRA